MIKITNGRQVIEVTNGAYETIFKKQGFYPFVDSEYDEVEHGSNDVVVESGADAPQDDKDTVENDSNESEEEPEEEEDDEVLKEIERIQEKPISQWRKADILTFAEYNEVDLTGTKNINEAREMIKKALGL